MIASQDQNTPTVKSRVKAAAKLNLIVTVVLVVNAGGLELMNHTFAESAEWALKVVLFYYLVVLLCGAGVNFYSGLAKLDTERYPHVGRYVVCAQLICGMLTLLAVPFIALQAGIVGETAAASPILCGLAVAGFFLASVLLGMHEALAASPSPECPKCRQAEAELTSIIVK